MTKIVWARSCAIEATPFWRRLVDRAQIQAVIVDGQYQHFLVRVPHWPFVVLRHLRRDQLRFAFIKMIDERIRLEVVAPSGVSEETLVLWRKRAEERHSVPRRLVGRWDLAILCWHSVKHS